MNIQTNSNIQQIIGKLNVPILIFCNDEDTYSIISSLDIVGEINETNTGHRITSYPDNEIVKVVRFSDTNRINSLEQYSTIIYL